MIPSIIKIIFFNERDSILTMYLFDELHLDDGISVPSGN